jgi:type I restriction enzyme M protein
MTYHLSTSSMMELMKPYLPVDQAVQELCLLISWSIWVQCEFPRGEGISAGGLERSFEEAASSLGTGLFNGSRLFNNIPMRVIDELIQEATIVANVAKSKPRDVALDLIAIQHCYSTRRSEIFITKEIGELLVDALGSSGPEGEVVLYHDSSLMALCALPKPQSAILSVSKITPLAFAVSYMLGARLDECLPECLFNKTKDRQSTVISIPPFGTRVETYHIQTDQEIETRTVRTEDGAFERAVDEVEYRAVLLLPLSVLSSRASLGVRKKLIDNNWLSTLLHIPRRQLTNTSADSVCLVIDKQKGDQSKIMMSEPPISEFSRFIESQKIYDLVAYEPDMDSKRVDTDLIRNQGYDLAFSRYKDSSFYELFQEDNKVALNGVAEIIRTQAVKGEVCANEAPNSFRQVTWRDISEAGYVIEPPHSIVFEDKQIAQVEKQRLQAGDILLAVKGNLGHIALVPEECPSNWIAGQTFVIIRPRKAVISSVYLYRFLSSDLVQAHLSSIASGTGMKIIKSGDLNAIAVGLPTTEEVSFVESNHRAIQDEFAAIKRHRQEIERLREECWPNLLK